MIKPFRLFMDSVRSVNKTFAERDPNLILSAALTASFTLIATLYGQARAYARGMIAPQGVAADKKTKIKTACQAVFFICEGIGAYAHKQNDTVLAASVNFSISDLIEIKDADITTQLETIVAKARDILPALEYAEITSNELDAADDKIDAMDAALGNPRDSVDNRKLAGKNFEITLGLIRTEFSEQTDKLVNRLLVSENPPTPAGELRRAFAAKYEASRNIKGTATQKDPTTPPDSTPDSTPTTTTPPAV